MAAYAIGLEVNGCISHTIVNELMSNTRIVPE